MTNINLNLSREYFNLAANFHNKQKYKEMKKYYLMAINLNHLIAMENLGAYYEHIKNKPEKAVYYYVLAIKNGSGSCVNLLREFFFNCGRIKDEHNICNCNNGDNNDSSIKYIKCNCMYHRINGGLSPTDATIKCDNCIKKQNWNHYEYLYDCLINLNDNDNQMISLNVNYYKKIIDDYNLKLQHINDKSQSNELWLKSHGYNYNNLKLKTDDNQMIIYNIIM